MSWVNVSSLLNCWTYTWKDPGSNPFAMKFIGWAWACYDTIWGWNINSQLWVPRWKSGIRKQNPMHQNVLILQNKTIFTLDMQLLQPGFSTVSNSPQVWCLLLHWMSDFTMGDQISLAWGCWAWSCDEVITYSEIKIIFYLNPVAP